MDDEFIERTRKFGFTPQEFKLLEKQDKEYQLISDLAVRENQAWYDRIIINHDNGYLAGWNIFVSIITLLSAFSNLHVAAFSTHDQEELNDIFDETVGFWQLVQEYLFGLDILIVFFTEYKGELGDYRRTFSEIALNYLKTTFLIDFIAFFPFFEVVRHRMKPEHREREEYYNFYQLLFLLRLFRLYKAS